MLALRQLKTKNVVEYEDLLFGIVEFEDKDSYNQLYYVDAVIINNVQMPIVKNILSNIRKHYNSKLYLKPVFIVQHQNFDKKFLNNFDGKADLLEYRAVAKRTKHINERIEHLSQLQRFPNNEMEYLYKTLQFIYSREIELSPKPDRKSKISYSFPFLNQQLKEEDMPLSFEILKIAEKNSYLTSTLKDKVHLCSNCESTHHTIRETCTNCESIDLEIEDLIHHFKCAYVGPESDFRRMEREDYTCPKCDAILRHIGIDYDKPSHVYHCNSCTNNFQQPSFTSNCIDCGDVKDIQYLREQNINNYQLTSKGEHLVIKGLPITVKGNKSSEFDVTGVYTYEVFKHLLRQEQSRIKRSETVSYFGEIIIEDVQIKRMNDHDTKVLEHELSLVIKSYLKDSDFITARSLGHFYFVMADTSNEEIMKTKDIIQSNVTKLLSSNISLEQVIKVNTHDLKNLDLSLF